MNNMRKFRTFDICFSCSYRWKTSGMIIFYLLPSIEFFRDDINDDVEDYCFNLSFNWLFWSLTFIKYWGNAYKKAFKTSLKKMG